MTDSEPVTAKSDSQVIAIERHPSRLAVFRFSAITWNAHRIHYDDEFALADGLPGAVVQSHLHGSYLAQAALRWAGPGSRLLRFAWRPLRPVLAGERVLVAAEPHGTGARGGTIELSLTESTVEGVICVTGTAVIRPGPSRATTRS